MRFTLRSTCFLAVVLCHVKFSFETESSFSPKKSVISRRAIDGTRGRKYYDPEEDGFFDDYTFDGGQYDANQDSLDLEDIRRNVPGEPGVDYPAYQRLPQTSFSCEGRVRGYYADEEAGCQLFHVCDDILVSSFLCPVGSIFSQKLLTCDWWNKVDCSLTRKFYEANRHIYDQDDDEMLRKAYAMTSLRVGKDRGKNGNLITYVTLDRNGNDLPNGYEDILVDPDYQSYTSSVEYRNEPSDPYHGHIVYSQDYRTKAPKIYQDSPIVRIHKIADNHRTAYEHQSQTKDKNGNIYHRPLNEYENEFQPSYAPTVPTVTTTTRRYYSPTVPIMYKSTTPSYSKHDQSFQGSDRTYTHRDESQIMPTVPTIFYRHNSFVSTPIPIGQVRNVDVTNYSEKREDRNDDYGQEFGEDMEVRESIGLAQSKDERSKTTAGKAQDVQDNDKKKNTTKLLINEKKNNGNETTNERKETGNVSLINENSKLSISQQDDNQQQSTTENVSTVRSPITRHDDIVVQHLSTNGVNVYPTSSSKLRLITERQTTTESTNSDTSTFKSITESVSKPAQNLEPPEENQGFRIKISESFFSGDNLSTQKSNHFTEFSTIEYNPQTSPSRTSIGAFDVQEDSFNTTNNSGKFTTPSPLPVSHLPTINIPATEIIPPFRNLFAGGYYGTYPTTEPGYDITVTDNSPVYYESETNSSQVVNETVSTKQINSSSIMSLAITLEPPVYNHKDEFEDVDPANRSSQIVLSTTDTPIYISTTEDSESEYKQKHAEDDFTKSEDKYGDQEKQIESYDDGSKSYDYSQEGEYNFPTEDNLETTTEFDGSHRILNLLQIMVELAKTNRFPRPFTYNEPLTINVMSTTPIPTDNSHIVHLTQNSSSFESRKTHEASKRQDTEYDYPVYRGDHHYEQLQKTTAASSLHMKVTDEQSNSGIDVTTIKSDKMNNKEVVETEFVPSLSFALSTEQGRDEFAEAIRHGLLADDNKAHGEMLINIENSTEKEEVEEQ